MASPEPGAEDGQTLQLSEQVIDPGPGLGVVAAPDRPSLIPVPGGGLVVDVQDAVPADEGDDDGQHRRQTLAGRIPGELPDHHECGQHRRG